MARAQTGCIATLTVPKFKQTLVLVYQQRGLQTKRIHIEGEDGERAEEEEEEGDGSSRERQFEARKAVRVEEGGGERGERDRGRKAD